MTREARRGIRDDTFFPCHAERRLGIRSWEDRRKMVPFGKKMTEPPTLTGSCLMDGVDFFDGFHYATVFT